MVRSLFHRGARFLGIARSILKHNSSARIVLGSSFRVLLSEPKKTHSLIAVQSLAIAAVCVFGPTNHPLQAGSVVDEKNP